MLVDLGGICVWEVLPVLGQSNKNKAILRKPNEIRGVKPMTILMDGYNDWHYDNLEDLQGLTDSQTRIIYIMKKWGHTSYIVEREGKVIFT